jgi:hypothetical protein
MTRMNVQTLAMKACAALTPSLGVDGPDLFLPQRVDDPVELRLAPDEAAHPPTGGSKRLAVFVGSAASYHEQRLPVAGRDERDGQFLRFTPAFGFVAGQEYVVRTRRSGEPDRLTEFRIPGEVAAAPALVTGVYPSGDVLPENVLRFYVHFSVPMTPHLAADSVALRHASGRVDRAAFMRFKQELWNADRTRLTILLDPGRIKRSVATNPELGPALLEGQRYELTVEHGWPAANGSSVLPSFSKRFSVGGALREPPNVERWSWRPPRPGTCDALRIVFDRPFDRHLLDDALCVVDGGGQPVDGTPLPGDSETSWSFTPAEPWTTGDVRIVVDDALEDVAGNNFRELLDRDVGHRSVRAATPDRPTQQSRSIQTRR